MAVLDAEAVAALCHETVRHYRALRGEDPVPAWAKAPEWMRHSTRETVRAVMAGQDAGQVHDTLMARKAAEGWTYGPVRDNEAKVNPCLVPFGDLPEAQQAEDRLFVAIVNALAPDGR